jgi:hypothetical protein
MAELPCRYHGSVIPGIWQRNHHSAGDGRVIMSQTPSGAAIHAATLRYGASDGNARWIFLSRYCDPADRNARWIFLSRYCDPADRNALRFSRSCRG